MPTKQIAVLDRRRFLRTCAGCAAAAACLGFRPRITASAAPQSDADKAKIRLVFSHISPEKPTWPNRGYNYEARKQELTGMLRQACPEVDFLPVTAQNADDAKKILEADREVDGYLVYMVGIWTGVGMAIASAGQPTLLVDDLYSGSGEYLTAFPAARRKGLRVAGVASSRFSDVAQAVRIFDCIKKMKRSVLLDGLERDPGATAKAIQEVFGTEVRAVSAQDLGQAFDRADRAQAREQAGLWIRNSERVVEPTPAEIEKSAAMYLGMRDLMQRNRARAITIDCLTLLYGGKLPAYPCLGFFQLNNDGLVGACEADLQSATTMLAMGYLTGRPGYISDPVIDTASSQIIYAHCVSTNRVFGPGGPANPYHIRNHSEDRKGAVVRSLMPLGETVTTLLLMPGRREVVMHQARTVANVDEDRACRTKLAAEVKDVDKLVLDWDRGWHRVTFYGDWKRTVENFAGLMGFKTVLEG